MGPLPFAWEVRNIGVKVAALMTLEEYLTDYASPETKALGQKLIDKEVFNVPNEKARAVVLENLKLIREDNRRDFRF